MSELKPCPFCGGEAGINLIGNMYTKTRKAEVMCKTFGCCCTQTVGAIRHDLEWCESAVIKKWNRRADSPFPPSIP